MMQEETEEWDYELYPSDGLEIGEIPFLKIEVTAGQKITVAYDKGDVMSRSGYIYDARGVNYETGFKFGYQTSELVGQLEVVPKLNGYIVFSGHFINNQKTKDDIFVGRYIKVKIE